MVFARFGARFVFYGVIVPLRPDDPRGYTRYTWRPHPDAHGEGLSLDDSEDLVFVCPD